MGSANTDLESRTGDVSVAASEDLPSSLPTVGFVPVNGALGTTEVEWEVLQANRALGRSDHGDVPRYCPQFSDVVRPRSS